VNYRKYNVTGVLYFGPGQPRIYIRNRTVIARDEADAAEQIEQKYKGKWINGPIAKQVS